MVIPPEHGSDEDSKYKELIEQASDCIFLVDPDGKILLANSEACRSLGYSPKELIGLNIRVTYPGSQSSQADERRLEADSGKTLHFERSMRRKDGTIFPVEVSIRKLPDGTIQGILHDITERRRTIDALRLKNHVFDVSIAANSIADLNGVLTEANAAFLKIWGYDSRDEVLGKPISHFLSDRDEATAIVEALDKTGVWEDDYTAKRKDGTKFSAHGLATTVRNDSGTIIGYQSAVIDITDRKLAELALEASEERYRTVADYAYDWEYWRAPEGEVLYMSPACERITGYRANEFIENPRLLDEIVHPEDRSLFVEHSFVASHHDREHRLHELDFRIHRRDGELRWIAHTCQTIYRNDGTNLGLRATNRDITDRKRAEDELRKSEELQRQYAARLTVLNRLDKVISSTFDMGAVYDTVVLEMKNLFPMDRTSLIAFSEDQSQWQIVRQWTTGEPAFVPKAWFQGKGSVMEWILNNKKTLVEDNLGDKGEWSELAILRKEGIASRILVPLIIKDEVIGLMTLASRIPAIYTERHVEILESLADQVAIAMHNARLFEQVQDYATRLEERVRERTSQLEATNKELDAFAYSVSHDLRTPLRSIDGFSQAVMEDYADKLDEKGKRYLTRVRAGAQRMAGLIDDLLTLSRLTRSEMCFQSVDLSAAARQICEELKKSAPERRVEFIIAEDVIVQGDNRLLGIALHNLLENSWKFTGKHPVARIEFGVKELDHRKVYFVCDDGAGFDMAYADKLFGAFQRLHSELEFPGTGIGLAIVQRVIGRLGGRVWAEAMPEQGASFYFTLSGGEE